MFSQNNNVNRLALGTVQFGLDYGISNRVGITHEEEVAEILKYAWERGIIILDTATSYKNSENVIGRNIPLEAFFKIVTKTPIFSKETINKTDAEQLKITFYKSLERMGQEALYGLLIHQVIDLFKDDSQYLWDAMEELKREGFVQKIGASVYSPNEVDALISKYPLDLIQLPLNVFDQRMIQEGQLQNIKSKGIEIHSRSVFLQGLLLMPITDMPEYFDPFRHLLEHYHKSLQEKSILPISAALAFVYGLPYIDYVLVGVNNIQHLKEIIGVVNKPNYLNQFDFSKYAVNDQSLINPSLWSIPR